MVWLPLLDVANIGINQEKSLSKLDEMDATDKIVFTRSKAAPEIDHAEA
jgi:hypothetical protein